MDGLPKEETEEEILNYLNGCDSNEEHISGIRSFIRRSTTLISFGGGGGSEKKPERVNLEIEKVCKVYRLAEHK